MKTNDGERGGGADRDTALSLLLVRTRRLSATCVQSDETPSQRRDVPGSPAHRQTRHFHSHNARAPSLAPGTTDRDQGFEIGRLDELENELRHDAAEHELERASGVESEVGVGAVGSGTQVWCTIRIVWRGVDSARSRIGRVGGGGRSPSPLRDAPSRHRQHIQDTPTSPRARLRRSGVGRAAVASRRGQGSAAPIEDRGGSR